MKRYLIACGGTGGHLAPGISLAEALKARGHDCCLLISQKPVDSRLSEKYSDLQFEVVPGAPFGCSPGVLLRFLFQQTKAVFLSYYKIKAYGAEGVIAFGGFSCVGSVLAALLIRLPVFLHEANRAPGKAIRCFGRYAKRVYLPEAIRFKGIPTRSIRNYGYPVRKEIQRSSYRKARKKLKIPLDGNVLVVIGGSQGAASLNNWVMENFEALALEGISVYCLTGLKNGMRGRLENRSDSGKAVYASFVPFSDDMALVLSAADVVISRAGAGSIAEIVRCKVPSILVPYPLATDNHQFENAKYLERQAASVVCEELDMDRLKDEVIHLMRNDWLRERFIEKLKWLDRKDSLSLIVKDLENFKEEGTRIQHTEVLDA